MSDETDVPMFELLSPVEKAAAFVDFVGEKVQEEVRKRLSPVDEYYPQDEYDEDLEKAVKREQDFCAAVLDSYQKWSQEPDPIVLWDVDQTMGYNEFPEPNTMAWRFRPSMLILMEHLQREFPNVKNGILTDRTGLESQLQNPARLGPIASYIDESLVYSSRDIEPSKEVLAPYADNILEPNTSHLQKLTILTDLQRDGKNVKIIDDNTVAQAMGENGLYVHKLMPRV